MTYTFSESLLADGKLYRLDSYPLQAWVRDKPDWPRFATRPWNTNGYMASWAVENGVLYLTRLEAPGDDPLAGLFPQVRAPVPAFWLDGLLHARRGERRHVGYPPRVIFDDERYLELRAGVVTREWLLDLRSVPDQTDDELRLSLPRFLWPARLRGPDDEAAPR